MKHFNHDYNSQENAIIAHNISKKFSYNCLNYLKDNFLSRDKIRKNDFWALKEISFVIKKGESVGILGENGSGKSTLLQIIANTLQRTSGSLKTNGRLAALLELGSGFNPEFTGRENIILNAFILGISKAKIDAAIDEIIEFSQIGEFVERPVKTYSSGMRLRLGFAVSVFVNPDILIIDEALSVGDIFFRKKCFDSIRTFSQKGGTLLFVSHNEELLRLFANRVILLSHGRVIFDGNANEAIALYNQKLCENKQTYYSELSTTNTNSELINKNKEKKVRAFISDVRILDKNTKSKNLFYHNELINIQITSIISYNFECLHFGIVIRNKEGVCLYSTETESTNFLKFDELKKGKSIEYTTTFKITFPIGKNSYSVEAYIIDRKDEKPNRIDWVSNASFFNVEFPLPYLNSGFKGGVIDLNAVKKSSFKWIENK